VRTVNAVQPAGRCRHGGGLAGIGRGVAAKGGDGVADLRWIDGAIEWFRTNLVVAADEKFFDSISAVESRRAGRRAVPSTDRGLRGARRDAVRWGAGWRLRETKLFVLFSRDCCGDGCWQSRKDGFADRAKWFPIWYANVVTGFQFSSLVRFRVQQANRPLLSRGISAFVLATAHEPFLHPRRHADV